MKILFTGSSSFTGYWFIRELTQKGHQVVACFRKGLKEYQGLRKQRIEKLQPLCQSVFDCPFGSEMFLNTLSSSSKWDMLCHHAAEVANYKSPDFDVHAALKSNTYNLANVLKLLKSKGGNTVLLTGSIFEQDEGIGSGSTKAFSSYGLSKGLTYQTMRYYTETLEMQLGKFVIPNPFGPFEEPRFTSYLIKTWSAGQIAKVSTPDYIRDNIHVDLLAKGYASFVENLVSSPHHSFFHPSGYVESQGAFANRFAQEMTKRLPYRCEIESQKQFDFSEPRVRINKDVLLPEKYQWNESHAWDLLANYYLEHLQT